jgi:hypothetical protein
MPEGIPARRAADVPAVRSTIGGDGEGLTVERVRFLGGPADGYVGSVERPTDVLMVPVLNDEPMPDLEELIVMDDGLPQLPSLWKTVRYERSYRADDGVLVYRPGGNGVTEDEEWQRLRTCYAFELRRHAIALARADLQRFYEDYKGAPPGGSRPAVT